MSHPAGTELLDRPDADPAAVRRSLGNIARANRWFGGTDAVLYGLDRLLASRSPASRTPHSPLTILDLGTGAGDIPTAVRAWGKAEGREVRTFGLERLRPAAALARRDELPVVLGCASALPFAPASVDVVTISQVIHHFERESVFRILREAARVARRGVVIADLLRSRTAATLFQVGARLLAFDEHTRLDGVTSVARGYAPDELRELTRAAGLRMEVTVRPGWRLVAWGAP